jgi:hypothetical protein
MIQNTNYDVRAFGQPVNIPEADIAKVMYYLNCVCTVIEYDDNDMGRYRNYSNWRNMSDNDDKRIFILAAAISPDELEDRVFFENATWCPNSSNQFYEIGQINNRLFIVQSIAIAGRTRQVKRIMAYKSIWMQNNYYQPMQRLAYRFSPQGQRDQAAREVLSEACVIS